MMRLAYLVNLNSKNLIILLYVRAGCSSLQPLHYSTLKISAQYSDYSRTNFCDFPLHHPAGPDIVTITHFTFLLVIALSHWLRTLK